MATVYRQGSGYTIQIGTGKDRRPRRLGRLRRDGAAAVQFHVGQIEQARQTATAVPAATVRWLHDIHDDLHAKLVALGLAKPRDGAATPAVPKTLGRLFDDFLARRTDLAGSTRTNYEQAKKKGLAYFGAGREVNKISLRDAKDFRRHLEGSLAPSSVSGFIKRYRAVFEDAREGGEIAANPWLKVRTGSQANEARMYFVDQEKIGQVLAATTDVGWRCLIALGRFGGLRTPSEPAGLRISDIDWDAGEIVIHSPKTRRQGKPMRRVPIFAELRPYLRAACNAAAADQIHLLPWLSDYNPHTHLLRLLKRAGLKPWSKLWQNLRATRETELIAMGFPLHVVCRWIGNSPAVAMKHYLMVTPEDKRRAIEGAAKSAALSPGENARCAQQGERSVQNQPKNEDAAHYERHLLPPRAVEQFADSRRLRRDFRPSAAKRAALTLEQRQTLLDRKIRRALSRMTGGRR